MATVYTRAAKGSALTWTEGDANITNLNTAKIENVVEDTTPQLGGNLDVNGNSIVSVSNGNIAITPNGTGSVVIDGNSFPQDFGVADQVLITDGAGQTSWSNTKTIHSLVYNADSVTINKGQPVYLFGANGANPSVKLASNIGDTASATTYGLANENIAAGATGEIVTQGLIKGVNTATYAAGNQLYLGSTAGTLTTTKPYGANHLVYIGVVTSVNAVSGRILVNVQNGYEIDELHGVDVNHTLALAGNHYLRYTGTLWQNVVLDISHDTSPQLGGDLDVNNRKITSVTSLPVAIEAGVNGNVTLTTTGTGDINLSAAATGKVVIDGLNWPTTDGTANYVLKTNGSGQLSWTAQTVDTNTTYSISAETATGGVNLRLTGSDATTDDVKLAQGSNITLTRTDANTITIAATDTSGVTVTDDTSTNATRYITFEDVTSGNSTSVGVSSTKLTFNPSTGAVTATSFVGSLSGNASTATTATNASNINIASTDGNTSDTSMSVVLVASAATGNQSPHIDAGLTYNALTNALTATQFVGAHDGIVGSVTPAAGTFTSLTANTSASLKAITEGALYDIGTSGGTIAPNVANGNVQKITLNSALTVNAFTSPVAGQSLTLIIYGGTAYTSITSTMKFAGGIKTLTGTAGCIDILSVYYDGTNYFASLGKGFA